MQGYPAREFKPDRKQKAALERAVLNYGRLQDSRLEVDQRRVVAGDAILAAMASGVPRQVIIDATGGSVGAIARLVAQARTEG